MIVIIKVKFKETGNYFSTLNPIHQHCLTRSMLDHGGVTVSKIIGLTL